MNLKKLLFLAIGLVALSIISAKSVYACDGFCDSTSTSAKICSCDKYGDCKKDNGKDCKCGACKDKIKEQKKACKESENKEGCQFKVIKKEAKMDENNASQQGRMARLKGWIKGLAFWKKK